MMAGVGSGRSAGIDIIDSSIISIDNIDIDTNGLCIIIAILSRSVLNRITGHPASHVAPVVALPKKLISMLFFIVVRSRTQGTRVLKYQTTGFVITYNKGTTSILEVLEYHGTATDPLALGKLGDSLTS